MSVWLVAGATAVAILVVSTALGIVGFSAAGLSRGAETPVAAAHGVLLGTFNRWDDNAMGGVQRYIDAKARAELTEQLRKLRAQVLASKEPAEITATHFTEVTRTDDTATVTVDVAATIQASGTLGLFATTDYRLWTFEAVHVTGIGGSGWKVTRMESPEICNVYLTC